jgi:adenine-specific DNA-methyltransferase
VTLKHAILERLARDDLKQACERLEIGDVDRRSAEAMRAKLSRSRRASPEVLMPFLAEGDVKAVAEAVGIDSTGRKNTLIERLLAADGSGQSADDEAAPRVAAAKRGKTRSVAVEEETQQYRHKEEAVQRPDVGIQDQFQARRPPKTYRYDSSLDPALSWDEQRERALGDWLLGLIERAAKVGEAAIFAQPQEWKGGGVRVSSTVEAVGVLKSISRPFLDWAGKAERHQIDVPTLPLFVHERHSTKAILDGIRHRKAKGLTLDLFSDPEFDIRDRLEAYEHKGPWQNRMILGDSLTVMNSLLEYEGLGGQVQMIYFDPPYGVKFGSNVQPFVRKKTVTPSDDDDMTREPEMIKAYRDTWELGLHSYLTYMRDRITIARELLSESGSIFVQISDENLHHVREVLDEVFEPQNQVGLIPFRKKTMPLGAKYLESISDYLLFYARDKARLKFKPLYSEKSVEGDNHWNQVELPDGARRKMTTEEILNHSLLPEGATPYQLVSLYPAGFNKTGIFAFKYEGKIYKPKAGNSWFTNEDGMRRLASANRLEPYQDGETLRYVLKLTDAPFTPITGFWSDTSAPSDKVYVVQTSNKVVGRCILMATDPGDLVLDPTCGSGTTAFMAEHWGRRWITIDTSRVPLALSRQRLLSSRFPYYLLKDPNLGPAGGFVYNRKQNRRGEEVGGVFPYISKGSIASGDAPATEILVDRPEEGKNVTRVSGPFVVEAIVAPVQSLNAVGDGEHTWTDAATHVDRMTEVLRQSKTLQLPGNRELVLSGIRRTTDTEYLHAEALEGDNRVAVVFGPEDGAISSITVYEAAREGHFLKYDRMYFLGFAIQANAREMIEDTKQLRIPASYVAVTPDVAMADLLKTTRASQIFSITGLPDFELRRAKKKGPGGGVLHEAELLGLDIFDPQTMESKSVDGQSVPCWMLDTDYDGMCFYATQVFFPKTSAWDNLQKSLKANFEDSVWDHLAGTVSEPFALGERRRVAVKVIDERGNELLRVRDVEA